MIHITFHAFALLLAGALTWLPGYGLDRWLGAKRGFAEEEAALRFLSRWILGLAFWSVGLFGLAASGLLNRPAMLLLGIVGATLAIVGRRRSIESPLAGQARPMAEADGAEPSAEERSPIELAPLLALLLALVPSFLLAINPTVSWDASTYHLTLPRLYLEHGGFRPVEMSVYSNWPLAVELLFAPPLAFAGHPLAKLVHFGFGLLVSRALFLIARPWGRGLAWLATGSFLANGVVLFEMRVAYVDLASAFYLLAGFVFLIRALDGDPARLPRRLALAGACGGLLAGVKITGGVATAILAVLLLPWLLARSGSETAAARWKGFASFAIPVVLLSLPWFVRNALYTGNPAYPFLFELWGGPDWSSELGDRLSDWQRGIGMGRSPLDYLLLPLRVILFGGRGYENFDGELGLHWLIALPVALWACRRAGLAQSAMIVAGLSFAFWALSSQQMRFLIPILPLLALATARGVFELGEAARGKTTRLAPLFGRPARALGLLLASLVFAAFLFVAERRLLGAGISHLRLYLQAEFQADPMAARPKVFDLVDLLPETAKLLMIDTNQGFYCSREYLADSFFEASQISAWLRTDSVEEVARRLANRDISHILVDRRRRGIDYPRALIRFVQDPSRAKPIHVDERHVLLALAPPASESGPPGR